jgi:hypothetical protein
VAQIITAIAALKKAMAIVIDLSYVFTRAARKLTLVTGGKVD